MWDRDRGCGEARCLPPGEGSMGPVENLAKGFALLYQMLIAVSVNLAGSLKGWCPSKTSEASAAWQPDAVCAAPQLCDTG